MESSVAYSRLMGSWALDKLQTNFYNTEGLQLCRDVKKMRSFNISMYDIQRRTDNFKTGAAYMELYLQ